MPPRDEQLSDHLGSRNFPTEECSYSAIRM